MHSAHSFLLYTSISSLGCSLDLVIQSIHIANTVTPPYAAFNTSDINIENFEKTIDVNIKGTMLCVRAVTKTISAQEPKVYKGCHGAERSLGRGSIVNLGSGLSYGAGPGMMAYVASKHAIMGITKVAGESFISPSKLE
jgi:NAD(P)-dependent dehydrogenase (short-subunit alcohol dehydrogenase family)